MKNKILYSSKEIKSAIKNIFNTKQRRVAISAFVGDEADAYLPKPRGIELYCWAKAGGTNPKAIRRLIELGVNVYFSESLHMKIYWSNKGVVITSANLSIFALGSGGLKEIGVLLPSKAVNINKILKSIKPYKATEKEIAKLEQSHREVVRTNSNLSIKSNKNVSFKEWFNMNRNRKEAEWRLASYSSSNAKAAPESKEYLKNIHGSDAYSDLIEMPKKKYKQNDWLLFYKFNKFTKNPIDIGWMYVDHVIKVSVKIKRKKEICYQNIQVNKLKSYDKPPFQIDATFKKAFIFAHQEYYDKDEDKMENDIVPPKKLLQLINGNI